MLKLSLEEVLVSLYFACAAFSSSAAASCDDITTNAAHYSGFEKHFDFVTPTIDLLILVFW